MLRPLALASCLLLAAAGAQAQTLPQLTGLIRDCGTAEAQPSICRQRTLPSVQDAEAILAGNSIGARREKDALTIVARAAGDDVSLINGLHASMGRVKDDLWALTIQSPWLDQASLPLIAISEQGRTGQVTWRGPRAPPEAAFERDLRGQLLQRRITSAALEETRTIAIYLPPGHTPSMRYPVAYIGDGEDLGFTARIVEASIRAGRLPPLILVGIPSGSDEERSRAYLVHWRGSNAGFEAHERFLLQEVLPQVEQEFGASSERQGRLLIGKSSSGAWALDTAIRNPGVFGQAAPFAVGYARSGEGVERKGRPRLMLVTGIFDDFIVKTREIANRARSSGDEVVLLEPVAGHGGEYYENLLERALAWAFDHSPR